MGLHLGYLKEENLQGPVATRSNGKGGPGPDAKGATAGSSGGGDAVSDLRTKAKNVIHIATIIMCSSRQHKTQRMISVILGPVRKWHGWQASFLRSPGPTTEFCKGMAAGDWLRHLNEVVLLLRAPSKLHLCGLTVAFPADLLELGVDNALVAEEDEFAMQIMALVFQLLRFRTRACLMYSSTYPLAFAALLDEPQVPRALQSFKEAVLAWEAAGKCDLPLAQRLHQRSPLGWSINVIMANFARRAGWTTVTPAMKDMLEGMFCPCLAQQKIVEDWFQRARASESKNTSKTCLPAQAWMSALRGHLLDEVYQWNEVSGADSREDASLQVKRRMLPTGIFHPRQKSVQVSLDAISSHRPEAEYETFNAQSAATVLGDAHIMRHCSQNEAWHEASGRAWLTVLLETGTICRAKGDATWSLSCGHLGGHVAIGWPVKVEGPSGNQCVVLEEASLTTVRWLTVLAPKDWECLDVRWPSPLHQAILSKQLSAMPRGSREHCHGQGQAACLKAIVMGSRPVPLLKHCALNCFGQLPIAPLRQLCDLLGLQVSEDTLLGVLQPLLKKLLPDRTGTQLNEILSKRLFSQRFLDHELLQDPEVEDCFEDGDQEILKEYLEGVKVEKQSRARFNEDLKKAKAKVAAALGEPKARKRKAKPIQWPAEEGISVEWARQYLPHSASRPLQKDTYNNRWLTFSTIAGTRRCISRSWPLYGEKNALLHLARQAWIWHSRLLTSSAPSVTSWR